MKTINHKLNYFITIVFCVFIITFFSGCIKQNKNLEAKEIKGEYLGQQKPGNSPEIFAPDFISKNLGERDAAFTPAIRPVTRHSELLPPPLSSFHFIRPVTRISA